VWQRGVKNTTTFLCAEGLDDSIRHHAAKVARDRTERFFFLSTVEQKGLQRGRECHLLKMKIEDFF